MKVLVLDNYDSFTYNLVQYLGELGADVEVVRNDHATVEELLIRGCQAVVVSPGPCTPDESGISLEAVRAFPEAGIPTLGVCLGHQALAQAFGGKVVRHEPVHGKICEIEHDGTTIFEGLPSPLTVGRYHSLVVEESSLPAELEVSATTVGDPASVADGGARGRVIQAIRHRTLPAEGIQFHPESVLTPQGHALLRNFLAAGARAAVGGIA